MTKTKIVQDNFDRYVEYSKTVDEARNIVLNALIQKGYYTGIQYILDRDPIHHKRHYGVFPRDGEPIIFSSSDILKVVDKIIELETLECICQEML